MDQGNGKGGKMEQLARVTQTEQRDHEGLVRGGSGATVQRIGGAPTMAAARLLFVGPKTGLPDCDQVDGVRLTCAVAASQAADHLRQMVAADIVWLTAAESIASGVFADIVAVVADRGCRLICETSLAGLDRVAAMVPEAVRTEWLVDATSAERLSALAASRRSNRLVVHDVARDGASERIDRLQEEVERILRLLGELNGPRAFDSMAARGDDFSPSGGAVRAPARDFAVMPRSFEPEERTRDRHRAKTVRRMLRQRRMREQHFPADLFADPAWDMLLDLYAARLERQPVSVSSLCIAAAVPATTALRWIKTMTDAGIFLREADPQDGRRIFIALSDGACDAMARYFEALDE